MSLLLLSGCAPLWGDAEPEYELTTTGKSAATGAAIGAGVGALIGSATGNAGEGLVLGALAGAATGGVVGNQFEQQENQLHEQGEKIRRQEELLENRRRDVDQLRRGTQDYSSQAETRTRLEVTPQQNIPARGTAYSPPIDPPRAELSRQAIQAEQSSSYLDAPIRERRTVAKPIQPEIDLSEPQPDSELSAAEVLSTRNPPAAASLPPARQPIMDGAENDVLEELFEEGPAAEKEIEQPIAAITPAAKINTLPPTASINKMASKSSDPACADAEQDAEKAINATSTADKLFYYKRALHLCPKEAQFHIAAGKVYVEIGQTEDAKFEFRQAIDLDPGNEEAQQQLSLLEQGPENLALE